MLHPTAHDRYSKLERKGMLTNLSLAFSTQTPILKGEQLARSPLGFILPKVHPREDFYRAYEGPRLQMTD